MSRPPAKRRWPDRLLAGPALALLTAGALGLFLRYTVKDRLPILAALFYGLPPLVVLVLLLASFGLYLFLRRRRRALASGLLTILAIGSWIQTDFVYAPAAERRESQVRIILWNACPLVDQSGEAFAILKEADAQIILMVESGASFDYHRQQWQSRFPDYHICMLGDGMTFLSKYPISNPTLDKLGGRTQITAYNLTTPFGDVSVVGVDIESNPLAWRRPFMERIVEIVRARPHPVIVLGDFNTPATSAQLNILRRSLQHAVETSATGLVTTWPSFCPVLALDHIWLSEHFLPVRAAVHRTLHSDHALVMADVSLPRPTQSHAQTVRSTDD